MSECGKQKGMLGKLGRDKVHGSCREDHQARLEVVRSKGVCPHAGPMYYSTPYTYINFIRTSCLPSSSISTTIHALMHHKEYASSHTSLRKFSRLSK